MFVFMGDGWGIIRKSLRSSKKMQQEKILFQNDRIWRGI